MPERSGYKTDGGWSSGNDQVNGNSITQTLTVNDRDLNTPDEYKASKWIELTDGFESGSSDEFVAYIADGSNTTPGNTNGSGGENNSYRYGFNGKENDDEVKGIGNEVDFGARIYDTRVGRFFSIDPQTSSNPMMTPYQYAANTPIVAIDFEGKQWITVHTIMTLDNGKRVVTSSESIWVSTLEEMITGLIRTPVDVFVYVNPTVIEQKNGGTYYSQPQNAGYEYKGGLDKLESELALIDNRVQKMIVETAIGLGDLIGTKKIIAALHGETMEGQKLDGFSRIVSGVEGCSDFVSTILGGSIKEFVASKGKDALLQVYASLAAETLKSSVCGDNTDDGIVIDKTVEVLKNTLSYIMDNTKGKLDATNILNAIVMTAKNAETMKQMYQYIEQNNGMLPVDVPDLVGQMVEQQGNKDKELPPVMVGGKPKKK